MNRLPSPDEILAWLRDNPGQTGKREIARAFGLKGAAKVELKQLLARMTRDGLLEKRRRRVRPQGELPPVLVLRVTGADARRRPLGRAGRVGGRGRAAAHPGAHPPRRSGARRRRPAARADAAARRAGRAARRAGDPPHRHGAAPGHRHLPRGRGAAGASPPSTSAPTATGRSPPGDRAGAREGELVEAEQVGPPRGHGLPRARVVARLGDPSAPRSVSLIAIHEHGIPDEFPEEALAEAEAAGPVPLGAPRGPARAAASSPSTRPTPATTTTRSSPHPDDDPANPGGHVVWVAIADVAHYVRPGTALDREARRRGNSTYFPDRVVPMLPGPAVGRPLLAGRRRRPALHRRAPGPRRRRPQARPPLHPRPDALGRDADLLRRRRPPPTGGPDADDRAAASTA